MKKIRVDLITESFYPVSDAPSIRMSALARAFVGYDDFLLRVYTSNRSSEGFMGMSVVRNRISATNNKQSSVRRAMGEILYGFETLLRLIFSKRDLVFITSPPFLVSMIVCLYLILIRKKYVLDVRDIYPDVYFEAGLIKKESIVGKLILRLERLFYDKALFVTGATQGICDRTAEKTQNHVELFRNGFDSALFNPLVGTPETFIVVFHGSLSKFQDIEGLVELGRLLYERDPEILLRVIGAGSDDYLLKDYELPNLQYLGKQSYEKVAEYVSDASVGISLRKQGLIGEISFPVKTYEYLGVGIPMICTPKCEAGYFMEEHGLGFQYESNEYERICEKILELKANKAEYQFLKARIETVRPELSREKLCNNLIQNLAEKISK